MCSAAGTLVWDRQPGAQLNLTLPVNWSSVPPEAEYRLALRLEGAWRARLEGNNMANVTAVHIFGVLPDQCPPGTYRCSSPCPLPPPSFYNASTSPCTKCQHEGACCGLPVGRPVGWYMLPAAA